jgi:hypothetical protein
MASRGELMNEKQRSVNQLRAEMTVMAVFGIPMDFSKYIATSGLCSPLEGYHLHAVLKGDTGLPRAVQVGDLIVACEVFPEHKTVEIHGVFTIGGGGALIPFHKDERSPQKVVALATEYLSKFKN